jgi:hypothetical protein
VRTPVFALKNLPECMHEGIKSRLNFGNVGQVRFLRKQISRAAGSGQKSGVLVCSVPTCPKQCVSRFGLCLVLDEVLVPSPLSHYAPDVCSL